MSQQYFPTAIVGSNPLLRESLSRFLQKSSFNVAALASCVDELSIAALSQDRDILLIIDGCDHPGEACSQIERFRQDHPSGRVVVLANHCAPGDLARVLRSGANGYFATIATCDDFIKSLELVMGGQTVLPSEALESVLVGETSGAGDVSAHCGAASTEVPVSIGSVEMPQLSARELYILRCLTEGSSNKVIARECDIAEGTVKVHVKAILRKVKVKNRTQAAIWALNNRALVWSSENNPRTDTAVDGLVIDGQLEIQKVDTVFNECSTEQIERAVHGQTQLVKPVAGEEAFQ
jgi:two-component system nitrate/nitrite response regulator NarL